LFFDHFRYSTIVDPTCIKDILNTHCSIFSKIYELAKIIKSILNLFITNDEWINVCGESWLIVLFIIRSQLEILIDDVNQPDVEQIIMPMDNFTGFQELTIIGFLIDVSAILNILHPLEYKCSDVYAEKHI